MGEGWISEVGTVCYNMKGMQNFCGKIRSMQIS